MFKKMMTFFVDVGWGGTTLILLFGGLFSFGVIGVPLIALYEYATKPVMTAEEIAQMRYRDSLTAARKQEERSRSSGMQPTPYKVTQEQYDRTYRQFRDSGLNASDAKTATDAVKSSTESKYR